MNNIKNALLLVIALGFLYPLQIFSQLPDSPYFGEDIYLIVNGVVQNVEGVRQENVDNAPTQSGVSLTVWVYYTHYAAGSEAVWISEYKTQTVVSSLGKYEVVFNLGDVVLTINDVGVEINNRSDWLIKYKSINKLYDTYYSGNLYVIPMNDNDKNGIRDDFEWELVKKYCPSLVPNYHANKICPEPFEIMGGAYNSKICVTWTYWKNKDLDFIEIPADKVEVETALGSNEFKPVIDGFKGKFDRSFDCGSIQTGSFELQPNHKVRKLSDIDYLPILAESATSPSHIWIHFNWTGNNTRDWDSNYQKERYQNNYPHTVYCTLWEETIPFYPVNQYQVAIQYWFFYPYDDWANDHEGDWEHINVLISSQFDSEAYIEKIQFYFHEKWKEWEPNDIEFDDNTHVMVYIGGEAIPPQFYRILNIPYCGWNSNASYPGKNTWQDVGTSLGTWYDDKVYGEGPKISYNEIINSNKYHPDTKVWTEKDYYQLGYGLILLRDANYWEQTGFFKKYPKYSWLKSAILVGEPSQDPSSDSFRSYHCPFNKPDWRQLGGFGAYQYYY